MKSWLEMFSLNVLAILETLILGGREACIKEN